MPIYEYECRNCHQRSSFLIMNLEKEIPELRCKKCKGTGLDRVVSRVYVVKSEEARMERLADPSRLGGLDENDPKSVARWMKMMGREMGEEMGGEDFDQMVDEAMTESEKGSDPGDETGPSDFGDDL
ncbi:MAG: zinc ribbon domain-containing protein [Deltaproteobacteria bacterium]|nr:zinc ribbon domain-containing protein [Deltaproteobacteria bacterium]